MYVCNFIEKKLVFNSITAQNTKIIFDESHCLKKVINILFFGIHLWILSKTEFYIGTQIKPLKTACQATIKVNVFSEFQWDDPISPRTTINARKHETNRLENFWPRRFPFMFYAADTMRYVIGECKLDGLKRQYGQDTETKSAIRLHRLHDIKWWECRTPGYKSKI